MRTLVRIAAVLALCAAQHAWAQVFPAKPVTLVCPWPPGGSTDTHLRQFAAIAAKHLGQSVVIENKPGAGGMVGVVVKSDSQFTTFKGLIEYARANPGKLSFGSTGTGTSPHLLMEEVGMKMGVQFLHVPFKGNADSTQALMGGHIMAQSDATGWGRHVDAGAFRLLVTFGEKRTKWNAPTAKELGIDIVSYSPYGIVGPKGMDPKVVKVLHDAFNKTLDDPEHMKVLAQLDQVYWYKSSDDYRQWAVDTLKAERATIERVGLLAK